MIQIIAVNGTAGCGKTTFEDFCLEELGVYGDRTSTIDFVKDLAHQCGWNGEKTPESRKFLSDFKDFLSDCYLGDVPMQKVKEYCDSIEFQLEQFDMQNHIVYVFVDVREPKNLQKMKDEFGAITLLIHRTGANDVQQINHADLEVNNFYYDYILRNDSTLSEWKEKAHLFINGLRQRYEGEF